MIIFLPLPNNHHQKSLLDINMAVAVFVKTLMVAALCMQLAAGQVCPTSIPAATFNFPQSYNGQNENFDWLISPTSPSSNTPAGDAPCASAVYIGQYTPGAGDPSSCITTAPTTTVTGTGCKFSYTQTDGSTTRTFNVDVDCDANAATLQPPAAFVVTAGGSGSSFTYAGTFKSASTCSGAPPPGPTPPGPGPNPGPTPPVGPAGSDFAKEPCSGGCAFLIVFFAGMVVYFVAAIVFNIVTGKRPLSTILWCFPFPSRCMASHIRHYNSKAQ